MDVNLFLKFLLAAVLGGIIGLEREVHGRAAGFRTHILVALGACLVTQVSMHIFERYEGLTNADPARVAAGVIMGIGFLGAGTIMRSATTVRGLTTAACLWVVAAIGLAVGSGYYVGALVTAFLAWLTLLVLARVEKKLEKDLYQTLTVVASKQEGMLESIEDVLKANSAKPMQISYKENIAMGKVTYRIRVKFKGTHPFYRELVEEIAKLEGVEELRWE